MIIYPMRTNKLIILKGGIIDESKIHTILNPFFSSIFEALMLILL